MRKIQKKTIGKPVKRTSLKDMAKILGVSVASVSRALHDSDEVGEELKNKVRALAQELSYRPNPFALSLKRDAPGIIGVITPSMNTHFHSSVISGIEDEARKNGYSVICANSHENKDFEIQCIENLLSMHVDGVIACITEETSDYEKFEEVVAQNIPIVFYARTCLHEKVSSVISDDTTATMEATQHLITNGCKTIGFVGGPNHLDMVKRRKHGFIEALHEAQIKVKPSHFKSGRMDRRTAYKSAIELITNEKVDGILTINYEGLYGTLDAIRERKLRVPEDIALIGFVDDPDVSYLTPSVSSVVDQSYEIGKRSCHLLLKQIFGDKSVCHEVLPMRVNIRESSKRH